jgi:hypothetical protein
VREIVIVISDLYLAPGQSGGSPEAAASAREAAAASVTPSGFEHAARFGQRRSIEGEGGWRPWLARWLGRDDLAAVAPAVIAAASAVTDTRPADSGSIDGRAVTEPSIAVLATEQRTDSTAWIASPVHLIAGLTSLHIDRRSILRLSPADLESFAQDFNRAFGDTSLHLVPLANGEFLLRGPATLSAATTEPSRALVADLGAALPKGSDAKALKRLGAELEMWLHTHPLNEARQRRGELPVSALWLWGGGASLQFTPLPGSLKTRGDLAFGPDPYLIGLWHLHGGRARALPDDKLTSLLTDPSAQRAILVTEVTSLLQSNPRWTVFEALAELDRLYAAPAIAALAAGTVDKVLVIANDTELQVGRRDRLRFWRRPQPTLLALQPP